MDGEFEPNVLNTIVWLVWNWMSVATFAVNYKGRPYMEGLSANRGLAISLIGTTLLLFTLASGGMEDVAEYLELVRLPSEEARGELLGLMAGDFLVCWLIEKATARLFAYY